MQRSDQDSDGRSDDRTPREKVLDVVVDSNGDLIYHGNAAQALNVEPYRQVRLAVQVLQVTEMPPDEFDDIVIRHA